jgi:ABC-type glycerol-3-phosphate transport system permease component
VVSRVRTMSNNHLLVMVAGLVIMFASISPCAKDCSGFNGFAVAFGLLTALFVPVQMKIAPMLSMKANSGMLASQVVVWFAGTMFLTFFEPFKVVGNGFFACWAG